MLWKLRISNKNVMKLIYKILTAAVLLISLILINNDIKQREKYIDNAYCIEYKGTVTNKLDCKRYGKLIWSNWYVQIQPYDTKLFNPYLKEVDPFEYGEYNIGDKFSCRISKKDVVKNYKVTVEETKDRKYNNILNFIFFINAFAFAYFAAVIIVNIGEKMK